MDILNKLTTLEKSADEFGFRWERADQIMKQIRSECDEINEHLHESHNQEIRPKLQEEIGDLMHAAFSLSVFCQFDPVDTLEKCVDKFERRFKAVKLIAQKKGLNNLEGKSFEELMSFWDQAKQNVG